MSLEGLLFIFTLCHTLFLCFIHVLSIYSLLSIIAVQIGFIADLTSVILSFLFVFMIESIQLEAVSPFKEDFYTECAYCPLQRTDLDCGF